MATTPIMPTQTPEERGGVAWVLSKLAKENHYTLQDILSRTNNLLYERLVMLMNTSIEITPEESSELAHVFGISPEYLLDVQEGFNRAHNIISSESTDAVLSS